jgi:hypothetical protein
MKIHHFKRVEKLCGKEAICAGDTETENNIKLDISTYGNYIH